MVAHLSGFGMSPGTTENQCVRNAPLDLQNHDLDDDEYLLLDSAARLMPAFLG